MSEHYRAVLYFTKGLNSRIMCAEYFQVLYLGNGVGSVGSLKLFFYNINDTAPSTTGVYISCSILERFLNEL
jgi:hypothetical protein